MTQNQIIANIIISLFGVAAVFISQSPNVRTQRWASVCGLLGQPAWFYIGWTSGQMGIFLMSFLYTFSWGRGFWRFWVGPAIANGLLFGRR